MKLRELIEELTALEVDPETEVWVMDDLRRMEPEVVTHKRLGVVIM